jgi:MarR family transcriptional regulator, transcriptional regulator for hemolysin
MTRPQTKRVQNPRRKAGAGSANALDAQMRRDARPGASDAGGPVPTLGEVGLKHFVPYLINRIAACWNGNMQDVLAPFGMTAAQMRTLAVLSVMPGLTINELAVHAVTEQSTMSRTLDALEEQGLIRRQARTGDMRVREIYITEDGRSRFGEVWRPMYDMYTHLFDGIDETELRSFVGTLHKVLDNIRSNEF